MIVINKIKNKSCAIISIILLIALISVLYIGKSDRLKNTPSYIVANRWYDKNGKRFDLGEYKGTESATLNYYINEKTPNGKLLIFKSKGFCVKAFTKGRTLYESEEAKEHYNIIPFDNIRAGESVTLIISPCKNCFGKILSNPIISTQNEFLFKLIYECKLQLAVIFILSVLFFILLFYTIFQIKKGKRSYFKNAYLLLFNLIFILCVAVYSNLVYLITQNAEIIFTLKLFCPIFCIYLLVIRIFKRLF